MLCAFGTQRLRQNNAVNCINGTYSLKEGSIFVNNKNIKELSIIHLAKP